MAAEVSSSRQTMKNSSSSDANSGLITRDFLGVSSDHNHVDSKELDLDLHVPFGWEKRLDLQSGKVYIQRSNNTTTKTVQNQRTLLTNQHHIPSKLQDHLSSYPTLNLLEQQQQQQQPSLDLKLVSNTSTSPSTSTYYTSVCTLDKVKSALHRAERSSPSPSTSSSRKRWMSSPSPSNNSSSPEDEVEKMSSSSSSGKAGGSSLLVAAACPGCFLFVLVSKNDPKCPKCSSIVNLPLVMNTKKAKIIDLNISM